MKHNKLKFVLLFLIASLVFKFALAQESSNKLFFPQVFFDSTEAINMLQEGNSTISGISFAREGNIISGKLHNAVNRTVLLFPYTDYFAEWYNLKYANPSANIKMIPEAFRIHLETKTDAYGNFTFPKMKAGKYYLECSINYTGTAVGSQRVGTMYYYGNAFSYPLYESYYYNYSAEKNANKIVEVKKDGQLIELKLKPNPFESFRSGKPTGSQCYMVNNKQYGKCKEYYGNGKLSVVAEWEKGMLDGECIYYYPTGDIQAKGDFKKGFKVGDWKYYDSITHTLKGEEKYVYRDKMSVKEGAFKYYYPSGKNKSMYTYKDGKVIGDSFDYYESGKQKGKYFYKDGAAEGEAFEYFESGKTKARYFYKNNKLEGNCIYYLENGTIDKTIVYKNGVEVKQ